MTRFSFLMLSNSNLTSVVILCERPISICFIYTFPGAHGGQIACEEHLAGEDSLPSEKVPLMHDNEIYLLSPAVDVINRWKRRAGSPQQSVPSQVVRPVQSEQSTATAAAVSESTSALVPPGLLSRDLDLGDGHSQIDVPAPTASTDFQAIDGQMLPAAPAEATLILEDVEEGLEDDFAGTQPVFMAGEHARSNASIESNGLNPNRSHVGLSVTWSHVASAGNDSLRSDVSLTDPAESTEADIWSLPESSLSADATMDVKAARLGLFK